MSVTLPYVFDVTIPAGTAKATPLTTVTRFEQNQVDRIEWLFPPGCQGRVGIQIGARSVAVIPPNGSQFLIRSGDSAGVDLEGMHDSGDWSVIGYNTGAHDHTIHVTFFAHRITVSHDLDTIVPSTDALLRLAVS